MSEQPVSFGDRRVRDIDDRTGLKPIAQGTRSLHRPDELLVRLWAEPLLAAALANVGAVRYTGEDSASWRNLVGAASEQGDLNTRLSAAGVAVAVWSLPENSDVIAVVADLRRQLALADVPDEQDVQSAVGPNNVFWGESVYQGGPDGAPVPVPELTLSADVPLPGALPGLAILDTGLPVDLGTKHPRLVDSTRPDPDDIDELTRPGDTDLATLAGHGTFIVGLVHRVAPMVVIDPGKVLGATGDVDEALLALELAETTAPVVNLSLGGYTDDDKPPTALQSAIEVLLTQGRVIVAAAGNNHSIRPFWPAALKGVIAVGAFDSTGPVAPTTFSNFGPWVDAWAPGHALLSTYVHGSIPGQTEPVTFSGWARWSGTSFAAPLVAAEIARRVSNPGEQRSPARVALAFLSELGASPFPGDVGAGIYFPSVDLTR